MQRKKGLLSTLANELASLNSQLSTATKNVTNLPTEIATLRKSLEKTNAGLKKEIDILKDEIDSLNREIANQQQEITNEEKNEKSWDNAAELTATKDGRSLSSLAISLFPGIGEGYDITTLVNGQDPITRETLTPATKVLTLVGLFSGVGSGNAARKVGKEAMEKLAKELGMSSDEILKIAEEVAKDYKMSSIDDIKALKGKLSLDGFVSVVKGKVVGVKIGKVLAKGIKSINMTHINMRHAYGSPAIDASKYLQGANIESLIKEGFGKTNKKFTATSSIDSVTGKTLPSIEIEADRQGLRSGL